MSEKILKLKALAITCITVISLTLIVAMTLLTGLGAGEEAGIDIAVLTVAAGAITGIVKAKGE